MNICDTCLFRNAPETDPICCPCIEGPNHYYVPSERREPD